MIELVEQGSPSISSLRSFLFSPPLPLSPKSSYRAIAWYVAKPQPPLILGHLGQRKLIYRSRHVLKLQAKELSLGHS